jgi:hypothetical protein
MGGHRQFLDIARAARWNQMCGRHACLPQIRLIFRTDFGRTDIGEGQELSRAKGPERTHLAKARGILPIAFSYTNPTRKRGISLSRIGDGQNSNYQAPNKYE